MATAFTYTPPSSTAPVFYPGVPQGNLSQDTYSALPAWLQAAVAASTLYAVAEED